MTAKEYLKEIRVYARAIQRMKRRIKEMDEDLYTIGGFDYSRDRVQNQVPGDLLSDKVIRLIELQKKYMKTVDAYYAGLIERERQIMDLPKPSHRQILVTLYVDGMSLSEAANEMGLSYYRACHVHGEALMEFSKKFLS